MLYRGHDLKSDIWSFGVSLFVALTNQYPFDGDNEYEYTMNALQKEPKIKLLADAGVSEELIELIQRTLEKKPEKRISITEIEKFNWLDSREND